MLERLKVSDIVFGSETDNVKLLTKAAGIQLNSKKYQDKVKKMIDQGLNYPTALAKSLDMKVNIFNILSVLESIYYSWNYVSGFLSFQNIS